MKIKHFSIRLTKEHLQADEDKLNEFIQTVCVKNTITEIVSNGQVSYWSVLVFCETLEEQPVQEAPASAPVEKPEPYLYQFLREEVFLKQIETLKKHLHEACRDMVGVAIVDGVMSPSEEKMLNTKLLKYGFDMSHFEKFIKASLKHTDQETQIIDKSKQKGDDFEKWVAQKFDRKYFKLKSWSGDKYIEGTYAENTLHPDLIFEYAFKEAQGSFAVECKYRKKWFLTKDEPPEEQIEWAKEEQVARYKRFASANQIPTFVVLGVGGEAKNPESVFVLPLESIEGAVFSKEKIMPFAKTNFQENNFRFNTQENKLS